MPARLPGPVTTLWQAGRPAAPPAQRLEGEARADVAIIGGGFTGLSAAYHLKAADPGLEVAVLEAETCGYGASGRNAGFVMTLFGSSVGLMKALYGAARVREAHTYMVQSIDALDAMIAEHGLDCDWRRSGFLKVATSPAYIGRIEDEIALFRSIGIEDMSWLDQSELSARVHSPTFLGALHEPHCGLINPVKWVEALRGLAVAAGARIYEHTRVADVARTGTGYRITTEAGARLAAEKVVYATNGYTHLLPGMGLSQTPAFAYVVATEPLTAEQREAIGWQGGEGIEDARNFMHFYRLTADGRLIAGGGPGLVPFGGDMSHDASPAAWAHLEHFIGETFPALRGIPIAHRWGGAFSVTADQTPHIGTRDGGGRVYSIGCTGHGVAMTHMNGRIVRDLVLGHKTDLTDLWFVNRRLLPMPPEPLRWGAIKAVMGAMRLDDWWAARD